MSKEDIERKTVVKTAVEKEQDEGLLGVLANAVVDPRTVVVAAVYTALAHRAVVGLRRLHHLAGHTHWVEAQTGVQRRCQTVDCDRDEARVGHNTLKVTPQHKQAC